MFFIRLCGNTQKVTDDVTNLLQNDWRIAYNLNEVEQQRRLLKAFPKEQAGMTMSKRCIPYTPRFRELKETVFALVTTAGGHIPGQDTFPPGGPTSYRLIPR